VHVLRPLHKPHSHHDQNSTEQSTTAASTTAVRSHGAMLRIAAQFILPLGTALHLSSANRDTKTQTTLQASFAITLMNNFTQLHENAVKHNYKFIVQQYYCFTIRYVFRPVKFP